MERPRRHQQAEGAEHQRQSDQLQLLGGWRQSLEPGLEGGLEAEADEHLRAQDQHARLIERVFSFIR